MKHNLGTKNTFVFFTFQKLKRVSECSARVLIINVRSSAKLSLVQSLKHSLLWFDINYIN